jgi:hypothetical protein
MQLPRLLFLVTALATWASAPALAAQDGDGDGDAAKAEGRVIVEEDGGVITEEIKEKREAMKAAGGPPPVSSGLERYVQVIVSVEPGRVAPGAGGTLKVSLGLREGAVIAGTGDLRVTIVPEQGPLRFGPAEVSPPTIASQSPGFRGQPAWETYALAALPVAVAPGTEFGKYQVIVHVEASVSDADTGELIGRYRMSPRGEVVVGPPMATPIPRTGAATAGSTSGDAAGSSGAGTVLAGRSDDIERPDRAATGANLEPAPSRPDAEAGSAEDPSAPPSGEDGGFVWILAAAGAVVLGVLAVAALKRR